MVNGIGAGGGGLGRAAIEAALKSMNAKAAAIKGDQATGSQARPSFTDTVKAEIQDIDAGVKRAENLPSEILKGKLEFHEIAAQLKESELAFEFALRVRNKFIDAYREVMRMSV